MTLAALVVVSLALLEYQERQRTQRTAEGPPSSDPRREGTSAEPHHAAPEPAPPAEEPIDDDWVPADDGVALVAIIIDDVGYEREAVLELAALGVPLTFAVLPHQRHSSELATRLVASGHEVILHMPMEPMEFPDLDPGEGAVDSSMGSTEIAARVLAGLEQVPGATGVSNHMGSRATADPVLMQTVLEVVRSRNLYFLDSRTTPDTVGFGMARRMGIPTLERGLFLDGSREESYIEGQVRSLLRRARAQGSAVAIGHPHDATVQVLKRLVGLLRSDGIRLVPASELAGVGGGESG